MFGIFYNDMTERDFQIIKNPAVRRLIEENLGADPLKLALSLKCGRDEAALVCTQVKYLQRAAAKLPSYHAARCIIPPLSYEQASGEAAAAAKDYSGGLCIDLTCGLGADALHFSRRFGRVVAVERDALLAEIAAHNFGLLGRENIAVVNSSAEDFVSGYRGPKAGLIYVDPARRGGSGNKVFLLADCSPDVSAMTERLTAMAEKVLIKLSPLFDIEEALRVFAPRVSKAAIVSVGNETKELLIELAESPESTRITVNAGNGVFEFSPGDIGAKGAAEGRIEECEYLLVPDAAFYKGRLTAALFGKYYTGTPVRIPSETGFCFAGGIPHGFCGRVYRIDETVEYRPKKLKKTLKERGVKRINLLRRDFPYPSEEIMKALGTVSGGSTFMAFTSVGGKQIALFLSPK